MACASWPLVDLLPLRILFQEADLAIPLPATPRAAAPLTGGCGRLGRVK